MLRRDFAITVASQLLSMFFDILTRNRSEGFVAFQEDSQWACNAPP